jgi:hypothetical protein
LLLIMWSGHHCVWYWKAEPWYDQEASERPLYSLLFLSALTDKWWWPLLCSSIKTEHPIVEEEIKLWWCCRMGAATEIHSTRESFSIGNA